MKVILVRFSRPLLIMTEKNQYQTIFGCVVRGELKDCIYPKIRNYVGYLCGLSVWTNGGEEFSISFDLRGIPDWVDDRGVLHLKQDPWMERMEKKCMKKLNLSYTLIQAEIDRDSYDTYVNKSDLILDEDIFWDYGNDGLPF